MDLDHVRVCDCTLCRKRGALNHRVAESDIRLLTPLDKLTLYQWHTMTAKDYFCPRCGIHRSGGRARPRNSGPSMCAAWMTSTWTVFPQRECMAVNLTKLVCEE